VVPTTIVPLLDGLFGVESLVPLALALIAIFLLMRRRPRRSDDPERSTIQRQPPAASKQNLRRDLDELLVELQDLSRRISADIDVRFAKLEAVIRDADRRIAVLNRLSRELAAKGGEAPDPASDHEARHAVIYELADAGFSPVEIARDLGKTPGEVELILNLRQKPDGNGHGPGT
jgi:hypothetical protein